MFWMSTEIGITIYSSESMIKQIQLRGISRSPSDRMSEDGGCAESLNAYLDNTEVAPALTPEDITTSLGLPDDLQADKVFIHKTPNFEKFIIVQDKQVGCIKDGQLEVFLTVGATETIVSVMSFGNTIGVTTESYTYWVLFKNGEYSVLGTQIPFPKFRLANYEVEGRDLANEDSDIDVIRDFEVSDWKLNDDSIRVLSYNALKESFDTNEDIQDEDSLSLITEVWEKFTQAEAINREKGVFNHQIHAILSVKLIDGSELISTPILLSAGFNQPLSIDYTNIVEEYYEAGGDGENSYVTNETTYSTSLKCKLRTAFKLFLQINEDESFFESWRDVIDSINIYISPRIAANIPKARAKMDKYDVGTEEESNIDEETGDGYRRTTTTTSAEIVLGSSDYDYEEQHLNASVFRLFKSYDLQDFKKLVEGQVVEVEKETMSDDSIEELLDFSKASMTNYNTSFKNSLVYNSRVVAYGIRELQEFYIPNLNAVNYANKSLPETDYRPASPAEYSSSELQQFFTLTFYLKDTNGEEKTITARHPYIPERGELTYIQYGDGIQLGAIDTYANAYAFIICPEKTAYRVDVNFDYFRPGLGGIVHAGVGRFELKEHPYLNCSYYYGGVDTNLVDRCGDYELVVGASSSPVEYPNKIYISNLDSPFVFPLNGRHTFQSRIIGVAVATTALSQGQFGQFPLYVFTEDGIWAMETASDGSFVTSKPLSRDVCINAESITSIDNAVVFVTERGVMMIQGSQVTNLSPFMNGKHYAIEETPADMMEQMETYSGFVNTLKDTTPFMTFIKEASVAYDYTGKRLIFINRNKDYQYCFHLNTNTWHKMQNEGVNLIAPINSYPECLVQGRNERAITHLNVTTNEAQISREESIDIINAFLSENGYETFEEETLSLFLEGEEFINVDHWDEVTIDEFIEMLDVYHISVIKSNVVMEDTTIFDLSTTLDVALESQTAQKGVIITRPIDFGYADVKKTIKDIRIRGQYRKGAVKFMLLASDDGLTYHYVNTLRGRSWKLYRVIILTDLAPEERISWIDVDFEPRFQNRLR